MSGRLLGYEFLRAHLGHSAHPAPEAARVQAVKRVIKLAGDLAVPDHVAPTSDDPLDHLLFALKHEGMNFQAAILALKRIDPRGVANAFANSPASAYARLVAYLWELANGKELTGLPAAQGAAVPVFDPQRFLSGPTVRNARWRVNFNGLGTPQYCVTVRRTPALEALLQQDVLGQVQAFVESVDPQVLDRTVRWAYLSETDSSYAIEKEAPTTDKAEAFASLLARAHLREQITEEFLVSLQNLAVTNPLDRAIEFRNRQNWLRNGLPGAAGVAYLPPPPELMRPAMDAVIALANDHPAGVDAVVLASLVSFGFVFAHPFMDGNGRLSRYLWHKVACSDPRLSNGLVLPVSIAMKRHEDAYLAALESFSKHTRRFWDVTVVDGRVVQAQFKGDPEIYRYWDATPCVEFGVQMALEALEQDLRREFDFLTRFDTAFRAVNMAVDMNNEDLVLLVRSCLLNGGRLSKNRRKQLIGRGHPSEIIDAAEAAALQSLEGPAEDR